MGLIDFSLGDVGSILTSAREAITGKKLVDPIELAKLDLQLQQLDNALQQGQIAINIEEAKSSSLFVAGPRPFILWVCGASIAYTFFLQPFIVYIALLLGSEVVAPTLDTASLMSLTTAMLGLAGLRTYEKKQGVHRDKL